MTKVDIISGFLGAGKTTLIKKLLAEAFQGEKLVLIENEFGEVSVDGGFLQDTGVQVSELSSGCICCTLVGDFTEALKQVHDQYKPDRILIEPSGVAKLSDVVAAIEDAVKAVPDLQLNSFVDVVDASKVKIYLKNIPEYANQVEVPAPSSSPGPRSSTRRSWRPLWPFFGRRTPPQPLSPPPGTSWTARPS